MERICNDRRPPLEFTVSAVETLTGTFEPKIYDYTIYNVQLGDDYYRSSSGSSQHAYNPHLGSSNPRRIFI
jgi:hypothetical protein